MAFPPNFLLGPDSCQAEMARYQRHDRLIERMIRVVKSLKAELRKHYDVCFPVMGRRMMINIIA